MRKQWDHIGPAGAHTTSLSSRIEFLRQSSLVGIAIEIVSLITDGSRGSESLTIALDIAVLVSFICILFSSYRVKNFGILFNISMLNITASTTLALFSSSAPRAVFMMSLVPVVAYLQLRRLGGIIWSTITILIVFGMFILAETDKVNLHIENSSLIYAVFSCAIISVLLYIYEGINITNEKLIADRDREIIEANGKLEQDLINNKKNAEKIKEALDTAEKSNQQLESTKLAILNVLEDTNTLQKELRTEKASVELKVEERTKQLRKEQARLKASINSVDNGFLMTFADEESITYNPALVSILGLNKEFEKAAKQDAVLAISKLQEVIGDSFDIQSAVAECQKNRKSFDVSYVSVKDKGIHMLGTPVIDEKENTVIGLVVLVQDTTDEIMLERSKDEFMAIASHELRTPLTAIRGNASMLAMLYGDKMPDENANSMISDIKDSSVRLISIVNQFLSTSRLEQKRTVFAKNPLEIGNSIETCVSQLQSLIDEKHLKITINLPKDLPLILADEIRIQEVIVNLLGNAIKYTDKGMITIKAHAAGKFVQVDFTDTGRGIDPKNHDLLFHKFQQASIDMLTRDDSRSTGLGLYITKQLIEQMGGSIYLGRSQLGIGSVFTFTIPIAA